MKKPLKLCKDCKHSISIHNMSDYLLCSLSIKGTNVCNGAITYHSCSYFRFESPILAYAVGSCGKQGRFFEPKTNQEN